MKCMMQSMLSLLLLATGYWLLTPDSCFSFLRFLFYLSDVAFGE
jgi:hypothetical protein